MKCQLMFPSSALRDRVSNPTSIALILVATEEARVAQLYADERMVHLGVAMRVRVRVRVQVQARASGGRG